jgi:MraZ protein
MLLGTHYHTLEAKNRLSLPASFRSVSREWVLTRGLDGGLLGVTETQFAARLQQLEARSLTEKRVRDFLRLMANQATVVTTDRLGRVQLPEYLIESAGLEKHVVCVGSGFYFEIWDRQRYHEYLEPLSATAAEVAEKLIEV